MSAVRMFSNDRQRNLSPLNLHNIKETSKQNTLVWYLSQLLYFKGSSRNFKTFCQMHFRFYCCSFDLPGKGAYFDIICEQSIDLSCHLRLSRLDRCRDHVCEGIFPLCKVFKMTQQKVN